MFKILQRFFNKPVIIKSSYASNIGERLFTYFYDTTKYWSVDRPFDPASIDVGVDVYFSTESNTSWWRNRFTVYHIIVAKSDDAFLTFKRDMIGGKFWNIEISSSSHNDADVLLQILSLTLE